MQIPHVPVADGITHRPLRSHSSPSRGGAPSIPFRLARPRRPGARIAALIVAAAMAGGVVPAPAFATPGPRVVGAAPVSAAAVNSLESAASRASSTGRRVAMSLIALGFAIAAIVLAFRRDFREAAGVFAVGLVAIVLATPAGVGVLQDTVTSLFGGR